MVMLNVYLLLLTTWILSICGQPSQKNTLSNFVDEAEISLSSSSEDEAGLSLCSSSEDEAGLSMCSSTEDEAGISLCSSMDDENLFSLDLSTESENLQLLSLSVDKGDSSLISSSDEGGISLDSSSEDLDIIENSSTNEELDFETVNAKLPSPRNLNSYIFSEVSSGNKMKKKATSLLSIKSALKDRCVCGQECLEKINFKAVRELRNTFWYNSRTVRMQLLKYYISHSKKFGKFRLINVEQFILCSKAFCSVFRVNKNTFSRAINMNDRNVATIPGKNPRDMSEKTLLLMNWLEDYGTYHGDRMPDTVDILLPYKTVKTDLYWKYSVEARQWSQYPVSKSQFFKIWEKYFPHLKIKKTNSFSKCTTCTTLERQLEKTTCVQTRAQYKKQKDEHNDRQMLERKYYYRKRDASRKNPEAYMSLIVDGMDQSKTNLPHFTGRLPKNIKGADLLKTHITGVINHGHGGFHTYVDLNEYPHDPNLTINVLLKMLKRTAQRHVYLSFLYVGHTHEDVDAAFIHVAERLRKTDVEVLQDLLDLIPSSEMIDIMFDVKNWLLPEIKELVGVSVPLHYKFSRVNNQISVFYNGQHNCPWIQMEENILKSTPEGEPVILSPDFSNIDKQKQLRQVETVKHLFRKPTTLSKWQEFYKTLGETPVYNEENAVWVLNELPRQNPPEMVANVEIPEEIRKQIEKETVIPKVIVKKPKRRAQTAVSTNRRDTVDKRRKIQNSGTRNKGQAKKKSQKSKTKSSSRGQTNRRLRNMSDRIVLIPLHDEVKTHIWHMILLELFERYIVMIFLLYIFLNYLRLCCLLEMLHYLMALFSCIVETHIGHLALSIRVAECIKHGHKVSCNV